MYEIQVQVSSRYHAASCLRLCRRNKKRMGYSRPLMFVLFCLPAATTAATAAAPAPSWEAEAPEAEATVEAEAEATVEAEATMEAKGLCFGSC
jgi:hypothetical protein